MNPISPMHCNNTIFITLLIWQFATNENVWNVPFLHQKYSEQKSALVSSQNSNITYRVSPCKKLYTLGSIFPFILKLFTLVLFRRKFLKLFFSNREKYV